MYLNLIDVLDNDGFALEFCEKVSHSSTEFRGSDLSFPEGILLNGSVKNLHGVIEFDSEIKCVVSTKCARCFGDASCLLLFRFTDVVDRSGAGEGLPLEGTFLNLDDIAYKSVISEMPMQILCKSDCRGLCPKCGTDLNEVTCNCPDSEPDSRWDILKNLSLKDEV